MIRVATMVIAVVAALYLWWPQMPDPATQPLRLGVTTSVEGSGLGAHLATHWGHSMDRVVAGSGQVFEIAKRGDVDVILTHEASGEAALHSSGTIGAPKPVMQNRFFIAGPLQDPVGIANMSAAKAFKAIAGTRHTFISRGDDSGTHMAEKALWAKAWVVPQGDWYRSVGSGAGASLRMAAQAHAYILADEASFARFGASNGLVLLVGGPLNTYSVSVVRGGEREGQAQAFADWLTSSSGQAAIATFKIDGQQVFTPIRR